MNALWLLIGLFAGAGAVLVAVRPRLRSLSREAARAGELERELVRARPTSSTSGRWRQERLATINDAQERLSASFKALSADALQASMAQLTELARAQLQRRRRPRPRATWTSASRPSSSWWRRCKRAARTGRRPAAGARPGAARVPRAPGGAAAGRWPRPASGCGPRRARS